MENITIDLSSFKDFGSYNNCAIEWKNAIITFCEDWKGYSTLAHNFYFYLIVLGAIIGLIRIFWKPSINLKFSEWFKDNRLKFLDTDLDVLLFFRDICHMTIFIRIIQVWYIVNYILV